MEWEWDAEGSRGGVDYFAPYYSKGITSTSDRIRKNDGIVYAFLHAPYLPNSDRRLNQRIIEVAENCIKE